MTKSISVALATYNGANHLSALLQSLASQRLLPTELVVSDDNSTDETVAILREFAHVAPFPVRIIENREQLGIIKNFAKAFDNTQCELIAYCDQDDVWSAEKLEKCAAYFSDPEVRLVMHRSEVVGSGLQPLGYHIPELHEIEVGTVHFPSSPDMSYGLGHQMLFDARIYRDFAWIFQQGFSALDAIAANYDIQLRFLAGFNGSIVSLAETMVKFRRHESATSDAGLVDNKTATTAGFLGKTSSFFFDQATDLQAIATVFATEILGKMSGYEQRLRVYVKFLEERARLFELRGRLYKSGNALTRFKLYSRLLFNAAYAKKSQRGFGRKALLVDLFVATFGLRGAQKIIASTRSA